MTRQKVAHFIFSFAIFLYPAQSYNTPIHVQNLLEVYIMKTAHSQSFKCQVHPFFNKCGTLRTINAIISVLSLNNVETQLYF